MEAAERSSSVTLWTLGTEIGVRQLREDNGNPLQKKIEDFKS